MNYKNITLGNAAIVASLALTAAAFAVSQQALAGGHQNHDKNNGNGTRVGQQIDQANVFTNSSFCLNDVDN